MKYLNIFCVFCFFSTNILLAQEMSVESTISTFQDYAENHPIEKIYLHLDKPYYAAGEYMFFRAYLTDRNLSPENAASKIIYVELSDAKKNLVKRILLYSEQQEFAGQMQLSDSLPSAGYHLRAYTNWMRNAGEDYFYHRDIYIENGSEPKQTIVVPQAFDYRVAFFPEGGQLIAGLPNKVAFKALGNDGFGTDITGILTDSENKELLRFNSTHFGMGNFIFIPGQGKTYKVSVQSNGISKEYTLPTATDGFTLSARQGEKSVYITIRCSGNEQPGATYLIAQSRDTICYAIQRLRGGSEQLVQIDKAKFSTGIAQFTLFKNGKPVSERLMFIDRKDDLHVSLLPDKEKYSDREKATLLIKVSDKDGQPVEGSFSLAVTDDNIVKPSINEQNIKGSLLLNADLKGNIESPGWYFAGDEPERAIALDNLLCTQGWTRFVWTKLTTSSTSNVYPVESEFQFTGKVTNLVGKPVPNITVSLLSKQNVPGIATTDENGLFGFYGFDSPEGSTFMLQCQAKNSRKGIGFKLDKLDNRQSQTDFLPLAKRDNQSNNAIMTSFMEKVQQRLKIEEDIRLSNLPEGMTDSSKIKIDNTIKDQRAVGVRSYHYGENRLNRKVFITNFMQTMPKPTQGPYSLFAIPPSIWYIVDDGMRMDWDTFSNTYSGWYANQFESVDILSAEDAVGLHGLDFSRGAYILKTKKITQGNDIPDASVQVVQPEGYCVRKEFYVPTYNSPEERQNASPDFRTTIYWNPVIHTNKAGEAKVSFFTADNTGNYSYILEGIGNNQLVFSK